MFSFDLIKTISPLFWTKPASNDWQVININKLISRVNENKFSTACRSFPSMHWCQEWRELVRSVQINISIDIDWMPSRVEVEGRERRTLAAISDEQINAQTTQWHEANDTVWSVVLRSPDLRPHLKSLCLKRGYCSDRSDTSTLRSRRKGCTSQCDH